MCLSKLNLFSSSPIIYLVSMARFLQNCLARALTICLVFFSLVRGTRSSELQLTLGSSFNVSELTPFCWQAGYLHTVSHQYEPQLYLSSYYSVLLNCCLMWTYFENNSLYHMISASLGSKSMLYVHSILTMKLEEYKLRKIHEKFYVHLTH